MSNADLVLDACSGHAVGPTGWIRANCPLCEQRTGKADHKQCLGLRAATGFFHCFAGETRVLTRDGYVEIAHLAGKTAEVLTAELRRGASRWVKAPFYSFGVQPIMTITMTRNGVRKVIRATAGHRWFIRGSAGAWRTVTTADLRRGHRLRGVVPPRSGTTIVSPWGAAHGIAFGDGMYAPGRGVCVNLWGAKDAALLSTFPLSPRSKIQRDDLEGVRVDGLPRFFKDRPSLDESPAYLLGWLAGYFAADGCVDKTGCPKLASASLENIEFVRRLCLRVGVFAYEPTVQMRVGYGTEPTPLYTIVFSRASLSEAFFLIDEHRRRWKLNREVAERRGWVVESVIDEGDSEEVFCAEVEETHSFVLEGHILTGNCFRCGSAGVVTVNADLTELTTVKPDAVRDRIDPPAYFFHLYEEPGWSSWAAEPARQYLRARGIEDDLGHDAKIGVCLEGKYRGRVIVPVHDATGRELLGWIARDYTGRADRKVLNPQGMRRVLYNHAALFARTDDPVFVVEGVFDALAFWPDAVACLGKPTTEHLEALLGTDRPVVVLLDGDAWRESEALAMKLRIYGRRAAFVRLQPRTDPATSDVNQVRELAAQALVA